jgi:mRNA interferase RelE/StbE
VAFGIVLTRAARRGLAALSADAQRRVDAAILALAEEPRPHGCQKLQGGGDFWRIRIGDYRVIYRVLDKERLVEIVNIGHRRDIYR